MRYATLLILLCVLGFNVSAQNNIDSLEAKVRDDSVVDKNSTQLWLTLGIMSGSIQKEDLIGIIAGINLQYNHHLFSARLISSKSYQENIQPLERAFEVGVLYGYGVNNSLWYANISTGLSYVSITRRILVGEDPDSSDPLYEAKNYKDIGIPWQGRIFSKFSDSSKVGLGFSISRDVNKPGSFFFISLALEIFLL